MLYKTFYHHIIIIVIIIINFNIIIIIISTITITELLLLFIIKILHIMSSIENDMDRILNTNWVFQVYKLINVAKYKSSSLGSLIRLLATSKDLTCFKADVSLLLSW